MKYYLLFAVLLITVYTYDRTAVQNYAKKYWNTLNHKCDSKYSECTPYSYWGGEHCGYPSQGGDCANFVSQCLLAGGHPKLKGGDCRGYPCGNEEIGATRLGLCLNKQFGWKRDCGYQLKPPSDVQIGDVLIYHKGSCSDYDAHATVVVKGGSDAQIACHSTSYYGKPYTYLSGSLPYYEWLRYPGGSSPDPEPQPEPSTEVEKMVKIIATDGVNRRAEPSTSATIVGGYTKGTKVSVVAKSGDWYKDKGGYWLTADSRWVTDLIGTVTADVLNVRSSASTSASVITTITEGTKVTCLKTSNEWYYVKLSNGTKGWCSGTYLKF